MMAETPSDDAAKPKRTRTAKKKSAATPAPDVEVEVAVAPPPEAVEAQTTPPLATAEPQRPEALHFNPRDLMERYLKGDHEGVADSFLAILKHFRDVTYYKLDAQASYFLNAFVKNFLYIFTQEDFVPETEKLLRFLEYNVTIANITAMSEFRNTDAYVTILLAQKKNFVKLLALYSPRNTIRLNRKVLFDTDAIFASIWYHAFLENYKTSSVSRNGLEHQRFHLEHQDHRMSGVNAFIHHAYFGCTYIDHENDYRLKQRINRLVKDWSPAQKKVERRARKSGKPKIGVFTSMWFPRQSVYRSQHPFIDSLKDDYELHLIHLGRERANLDTAQFASVANFRIQNADNYSAFSPNDFDIAYFPDVGMNLESIFLANLRIAPIQISNYGHPVSTFGSEIDYWIGGQSAELEERAPELYSERLVLIPGVGQLPVYPDYKLRYPTAPAEPVLVNCSWTGQKINFEHLVRLKEVIARAKTRAVFRFFPGGSALNNGYIPLKRDVEEVLGAENCVVFRDLDYQTYMHAMEAGHFSIDSWPFGGYNSAIDHFFLRKPLICLRGDRFYNRAASDLASRVGLDDCICDTPEDWISRIVQMIDDVDYRERLVKRLRVADLDSTVLRLDEAKDFKAAIDHIHRNHDALKASRDRSPIRIGG